MEYERIRRLIEFVHVATKPTPAMFVGASPGKPGTIIGSFVP